MNHVAVSLINLTNVLSFAFFTLINKLEIKTFRTNFEKCLNVYYAGYEFKKTNKDLTNQHKNIIER